MRRWTIAGLVLATLGCGGVDGGVVEGVGEGVLGRQPSGFATATAKMLADENDGVECRLTSTGGGTTRLLDFEYTFGDPEVRPYPDEMKPQKDVWGKVVGQRKYMLVVPVTIENTLPKKRAHDRTPAYHRTDGEIYDTMTKIPDWVLARLGKPNPNGDSTPYRPSETREVFVMLSVDSPESAIGSVLRMWFTEQRPDPNNPRRTYLATQDQVCVEIAAVTEVPPLVK